MTAPASILLQRRLEWSETDPMGRWHYSSVLRFVETAESLLHHRLGIEHETFPRMPRRNITVDYLGPLRYSEIAEVGLRVDFLGKSSLRYAFTIARAGQTLAQGTMTVVWYDPQTQRGAPWPDQLRKLLTESGPQPDSPEA